MRINKMSEYSAKSVIYFHIWTDNALLFYLGQIFLIVDLQDFFFQI